MSRLLISLRQLAADISFVDRRLVDPRVGTPAERSDDARS